jgi:hypothetical protein
MAADSKAPRNRSSLSRNSNSMRRDSDELGSCAIVSLLDYGGNNYFYLPLGPGCRQCIQNLYSPMLRSLDRRYQRNATASAFGRGVGTKELTRR